MKSNKSITGYSRAIFEIASEESKQELFFNQLKQIKEVLNDELYAFISNPAFTDQERRDVLSEVAARLKLDPSMRAFIILVAQQGRLDRFDDMLVSYRDMFFDQQGKALMEIYSAKKVSASESKKTGK